MKLFYLLLCLLGLALPYGAFIPWLLNNGLDLIQLFQLASVNNISAFAWLDVLVSAVVLFGFILIEGKRLQMKTLWLPIIATCSVGVSLGFPLFLYMREKKLAQFTKE
jgi:hypothetical protein